MDIRDIRILSVGTALPGSPVDNATLARRFGMDALWEQWVDVFIGTHTRHLAVDLASGRQEHSLADLGETAGRRALAAAGLEPSDVDLMVMGTATPDKLMPTTVNVIADRLGVDGVPTFQLQSGCTGGIQALDVAWRLLQTGQHRTALVLGGDVCTKIFDVDTDLSAVSPGELVNIVLFGDAVGACLLTTDPEPDSASIHRVSTRLTGLNRPPGQTLEWFTKGDRDADRPPATEDYKAIEESVPQMAAETLKEMLDELGWTETDIDYLLPPQLSGRMTAKIMDRLAVPTAQEVTCVAETGNTGNALPFIQLERALPQMAPGDRALCLAIESSKWIKAGVALERV